MTREELFELQPILGREEEVDEREEVIEAPEETEEAEETVEDVESVEETEEADAEEEAPEEAKEDNEAEETEEDAPADDAEETEAHSEKKSNLVSVNKIRIYSKPSKAAVARIHTGFVRVGGKIREFTEVEYVKPGFGTVKGFSPDLD